MEAEERGRKHQTPFYRRLEIEIFNQNGLIKAAQDGTNLAAQENEGISVGKPMGTC